MKKKIIIDLKLLTITRGGILAFFSPLLEQMMLQMTEVKFILVSPREVNFPFLKNIPIDSYEIKIYPYPLSFLPWKIKKIFYDFFFYPRILKVLKGDLLFSPYYDFRIPSFYFHKSLFIIHDLCYWDLPKHYSWWSKSYYKTLACLNLNKCKTLLTDSYFSLERIRSVLKFQGKIKIIYNFVTWEKENIKPSLPEILKNIAFDPEPLFLYTGGFEERKNINNFFQALKLLTFPWKLIYTGNNPQALQMAITMGLEKRIYFTGHISLAEMSYFYQKLDSVIVVNPSLYEGFGRSNLEAMSCNKPLVCSDIPVFREICGDYPLYFNPYDPQDMVKALEKALTQLEQKKTFSYQLEDKFTLSENTKLLIAAIREELGS